MSLVSFLFQSPKPATYNTNSFPRELCWFSKKIPCLWAPFQQSQTVLIYLHGNASDLGTDRDFIWRLSNALGVNVLAIEFPNYGPFLTLELPTEETLFRRVKEVCTQLCGMSNVEHILVLGFSLGCTAATHIVSEPPCSKIRALILYSPFSSLHDLLDDVANNSFVSGSLKRVVPNHVFHNHKNIQSIQVPIGIFHGTRDILIPPRHAEQLSRANPYARLFLIPDMTHNISASSRLESDLLTQTREFVRGVLLTLPSSRSVPVSTSSISFPQEFWTAPTLLDHNGGVDGTDRSHSFIFFACGLVVLALYLLRRCHARLE